MSTTRRVDSRPAGSPRSPFLFLVSFSLLVLASTFGPAAASTASTAPDLRKDEAPAAGVLKLDDAIVAESAGVALVKVERSKGEDGAVSVTFTASPGTASSPEDFQAVTTLLSWGHDDGSDRWVEIPIVADGISEGVETVQLALSGATGGAVIDPERATAVLQITDSSGPGGAPCDDPPGDDSPCDDSPGDDGPGDDSPGDDGPGDDSPGDDGPGDDSPGDDGPGDDGPCDDPPGDDSPCDDGPGGDDSPGDDSGGDDPVVGDAGLLKFDQRTFVARESQGFAIITVERSKGESGPVEVTFLTRSGTADAGVDYEEVIETLSWPSGDGGVRSINIPLLQDREAEGTETVELLLSDPTGGAVLDPERSSAVLTLFDDEAAVGNDDGDRRGVLKFDERSFEVIESAGLARITIERSQGESGRVTVRYRTSDGSAEDGIDYAGSSGVLSWASGDGSPRILEIPIFDDDADEGVETVQLELFEPTGGAGIDGERGTALLEILDDDSATTTCSSSATTLCLQSGRFAVEVVWRLPDGRSGQGQVNKLSERSGLFWFFRDDNYEMLFKTVDGCAAGLGAHWMYYAATTNVDFTVTVTDTRTGLVKQYRNLLGNEAEPVQDTRSFSLCSP